MMGDAATPVLPNKTTQFGQTYPANIDAGFAVADRVAWAFAPHEQVTPDMTVRLNAGLVPKLAALATEVAAQNTGTITAPTVDPRKDIVHIDQASGAVGVATGSEAPSPVDPAVPAGKIAVARINLIVSQISIVNNDLDDLRNPSLIGMAAVLAGVGLANASGLLNLDIAGLTALTEPGTNDVVPIEDVSVAARRKIKLVDLFKVIDILPAEASPAVGDKIALFDASTSAADSITLQNMLKVINVLTEDTTPDTAADFVTTYDASAAAVKKVKLDKISGGLTSISNTGITAITNLDLTGFLPGTFDSYEAWLTSGRPGTDNRILELETSTDGGSTFDTGASNYDWAAVTVNGNGAAVTGHGLESDSEMQLTGTLSVGGAANELIDLKIWVFAPETPQHTRVAWAGAFKNASANFRSLEGAGERQSPADVNGLRLHWSSGIWVAQGKIQFTGIKQS